MHTICPAYEGSVRTSWYPDIDVLKTISPHASPSAPHARPRKARPSSRTSKAGLFSFILFRRPPRPTTRPAARAVRQLGSFDFHVLEVQRARHVRARAGREQRQSAPDHEEPHAGGGEGDEARGHAAQPHAPAPFGLRPQKPERRA